VQTVADILGMPVDVLASDQSVALGAAMFAAVGAGLYASILEAQAAMQPRVESTVMPRAELAAVYDARYDAYKRLGGFVETECRR
jgi:L-ribulokinase